jgi:cytochrome c551/c552
MFSLDEGFGVLMRKLFTAALCVLCACTANTAFAQSGKLSGIGRTATPLEIKAWDIDVRPDFKGLPAGKGSVKQGEVVWESKCASCHGSFGESSEVFTPIAGGTTSDDVKSGHVKSLLPGANQPQRTTLMKLSTLSTLWDYINRAMPWNAPKTLTTDEVYAATAYILYLGNVLPEDFTLSNSNVREVQAMLPNRNGMTTAHALWPGKELGGKAKPDVQGSACMTNCSTEAVIKSSLPDYARNSHGNLADQSRPFGPARGINTAALASTAESAKNSALSVPSQQEVRGPAAIENTAKSPATVDTAKINVLLQKNACLSCHGMDSKLVGPSFRDVANRYKDQADAVTMLSGKIRSGGQGVWGAIPMPAQSLSAEESTQLAQWLVNVVGKGAAK